MGTNFWWEFSMDADSISIGAFRTFENIKFFSQSIQIQFLYIFRNNRIDYYA